jgi:hypothetical protein
MIGHAGTLVSKRFAIVKPLTAGPDLEHLAHALQSTRFSLPLPRQTISSALNASNLTDQLLCGR